MGQYRPSNLTPSTLTSTYSVDATVGNVFSCQINGNSPTIKYRLQIMQNNTTSTSVYDTGVVTLSSPLYPVSYDGTPNYLHITVPSTSGMTNGNEYKWVVSSYWTNTDFLQSYENVFSAYGAPTISIDSFPTPITNKSYTFSATVSQAQGVAVEKFGWILRDGTTSTTVIDTITSDNIYSSDIKMSYDGFLSDQTYEVKVKCWLSNAISVETAFMPTTVQYPMSPFTGSVASSPAYGGGIKITWPNVKFIVGTAHNANYSYVTDGYEYLHSTSIKIEDGNYITFNTVNTAPISISTNSSHVISFTPGSSSSTVYTASGSLATGGDLDVSLQYEVVGSNRSFYLSVNGVRTLIMSPTAQDAWYIFIISQSGVTCTSYSGQLNGLYPSLTLYPGLTLYPREQSYAPRADQFTFAAIPDGSYDSVTLYGPSQVNYLWVVDGSLTTQEVSNVKIASYEPSFTANTELLATFNNTLSAGNIMTEVTLDSWIVYRLEGQDPNLTHVYDLPASQNYVTDYAVTNGTSCVYYVFPSFSSGIGEPLVSDPIIPSWWDMILLVCDVGQDLDQYIVRTPYIFDLDVTSGTMNNNTSFTTLENFTQYAKIQNSPSSYWSGSFSALIGNCGITYSDTVAKMNAIKGLATDGKPKFLKDRKGNIWKIKISSAIAEQVNDVLIEQAVTATIAWSEIGDATNSSIVNLDA